MLKQTSSMFQQGISQSLAWHWHERIGCSPDGTCGASPAREGGYENATKQSSDELSYQEKIRNVSAYIES